MRAKAKLLADIHQQVDGRALISHSHIRLVVAAFALMGFLPASIVSGQVAQVIPEAVSCADCRITTSRIVMLTASESSPIFTVPIVVRVDQLDRIWVLLPDALPSLYSSDGRFLRVVGRKGTGPGEFTVPYEVFQAAGDSLVVLDAGTRRATILDAALRPTRYVRVPWGLRPVLAREWPRRSIAAALIRTPASIGFPLHVVRFDVADVGITSSFGPGNETFSPNQYEITYLPSASLAPNRFWTVERDRFRIMEWSDDARALRSLVRAPDWFKGQVPLGIGTPTSPPPPRIVDLQQDADGLLWVIAHRPKRTWQRAWPTTGNRDHVRANDVRYDQLYETVVEVIDPNAAAVVARRTLPEYVVSLLRGRRAVVYRTSDDGDRTLAIVTIGLEGR